MTCKPTDSCFVFAGRLRTMSNEFERIGIDKPIRTTQPVNRDGMERKRTIAEAMARANDAGSPLWRTTRTIPFLRPYGIALQALTYGLIMVDPLDRLDGGLID